MDLIFIFKACKGSETMSTDVISSKNIVNRNKVLKADKEKNPQYPLLLDDDLSKHSKFDPVVDSGVHKNSLEEDFVCFHSTVEGKLKINTFFDKHTNSKRIKTVYF